MKNIFVLAVLFLLVSPLSIKAQDKEFDNSKWTSLRAELLKRTDAVMKFQVKLLDAKAIDRKVWAQLGLNAVRFAQHLDSVRTINPSSVKVATKLDSDLTKSLGQTLVQLLVNDQKALKEASAFTAHLEEIEKSLLIEKQAYNSACEQSNKPELLFGVKAGANTSKS